MLRRAAREMPPNRVERRTIDHAAAGDEHGRNGVSLSQQPAERSRLSRFDAKRLVGARAERALDEQQPVALTICNRDHARPRLGPGHQVSNVIAWPPARIVDRHRDRGRALRYGVKRHISRFAREHADAGRGRVPPVDSKTRPDIAIA